MYMGSYRRMIQPDSRIYRYSVIVLCTHLLVPARLVDPAHIMQHI